MADVSSPIPVKGLLTNNNAAPASVSLLGTLVALVGSSAPTWSSGNLSTLSVDTSGNLRVAVSGGGTTVTYNSAAPTLTNGTTAPLQSDSRGDLMVTLATAGGLVDIGTGAGGASTLRVTLDTAQVPLQIKGGKNDNAAVGGAVNVGVVPAIASASARTITDGNAAFLGVDLSGYLKVVLQTGAATIGAVTQASGPWTNNVTQFGGTNVSTGTGTGGSGIPRVTVSNDSTIGIVAGTALIGKVGIDQTTPGTTNKVSVGTDTVQVSATSSANAVGNPIYSRLSDGSAAIGIAGNPLRVQVAEVSGTVADSGQQTSASVAIAGTYTYSTTAVTSGTARLVEVTASSSVRLRVDIQTFVTAVVATVRTFFVEAYQSLQYRPADTDLIKFTGGSGNCFKIVLTNMDNSNPADVFLSASWAS